MQNFYSKISQAVARNREDNGTPAEKGSYQTGRYRVSGNLAGRKPAQSMLNSIRTVELDTDLLRKERVLLGSENEPSAVAFKILRTQVHQEMGRAGFNSLGVTSPNPAEGKSTTSLNLAHLLASTVTDPVVLVDFDMHKPSIAKKLSLAPELGLKDYLEGNASLDQVLIRVKGTSLLILPNFKPLDNATEMVTSDVANRLMMELKRAFPNSYVIFDLPPVLAVDDAILFTHADANLVVAAESETTQDDLRNTVDLLKGHNVIGYVLNKSKNLSRKQKYGANYYYTYGYGNGGKSN